jgi:hypothetical protein
MFRPNGVVPLTSAEIGPHRGILPERFMRGRMEIVPKSSSDFFAFIPEIWLREALTKLESENLNVFKYSVTFPNGEHAFKCLLVGIQHNRRQFFLHLTQRRWCNCPSCPMKSSINSSDPLDRRQFHERVLSQLNCLIRSVFGCMNKIFIKLKILIPKPRDPATISVESDCIGPVGEEDGTLLKL